MRVELYVTFEGVLREQCFITRREGEALSHKWPGNSRNRTVGDFCKDIPNFLGSFFEMHGAN